MFCVKCGHQLPDGANFCVNCGAPSVANQAAKQILNTASQVAASVSPSSSVMMGVNEVARATGVGAAQVAGTVAKTKILTTSIVVAIVIAGIILYNMFFVVKPIDVVEKFIKAINEKDINTAVSCFDPKYEKAYTATSNILGTFIGVSIKDVADLFPMLFDFAKSKDPSVQDLYIKVVRVVSEETTDNTAKVVVALEASDGPKGKLLDSGTSVFYLSKFNSGWRIVDIKDLNQKKTKAK
ncbi:MAG: zinc-ribbon domain-containing protein [Firmicutes bacterium]|nr:zinc-ribbon domain-containing protein [Bacillota bacterium]